MSSLSRLMLTSLLFLLLTPLSQAASFYHEDSGLNFQTSTTELDSNWRVATDNDLDILFGGNLYNISTTFDPSIADAILGLGGTSNGDGSLTCAPEHGDCIQLQATCEVVNIPGCETLIYNEATMYSLSEFLYELGSEDELDYWDRSLLFGDYYLDNGQWVSSMLSLAGTYIETCEEPCSSNVQTLYVSSVPVPASAWLFGSALVGLAGIKRKK
jgi:hypothetical protein